MPINRPVRIVTRDGKVINGRRLNEDTFTVQIADEEGGCMSLAKADLREYTDLRRPRRCRPTRRNCSSQELADVVSYLLSLKGR